MKKLVCLFLILALALSLFACGGKTTKETPSTASPSPSASETPAGKEPPAGAEGVVMETVPGPGGEFIRYKTPAPSKAVKADPTTLYVGQTSVPIQSGNPGSGSDSCFYPLVFDRFIEFNYDTGAYVPHVLTEWKLAEDAMSMEITMRDDIVFHNGMKATIDDVLYSLWRFAQSDLSTLTDKTVFGNIDFDKTEKLGDYSARIVFKKPSVTMHAGFTNAWLLCKEYIESVGEENAWWNGCVGSGPYKVESIVQGDRYNLVKRSDGYWGEHKGAFDRIVIRFYPEASTMYMDFETGALDIIVNPLAVDVSRVINGEVPNAVCEIRPMLFLSFLGFNEEKNPALSDVNVRKAIALSIDPAIVTKMAVDFLGTPAKSLMHTGLPGQYVREIKRDVEAAKAALAEAGYKPGELKLVLGTSTNNVNLAVAESIQAQLAETGIVVEIVSTDPNVNMANLMNAGPDTYDLTQGFFQYVTLEPNMMVMSVAKSTGTQYFLTVTDEKAEELAVKALSALTEEEKINTLMELQEYLYDNWWYVPLYEQRCAIVYKDYITGIRAVAGRSPNVNAVTLVG